MTEQGAEFWRGSIFMSEHNQVLENAHHVPFWVKALPLVMIISGITLAWILYIKNTAIPAKIATSFSGVYKFLLNKWYFDELYNAIFIQPAKRIGSLLWKIGDIKLIDRLGPNGAAWLSLKGGIFASKVQTGYVYHYAFAMMVGLLALISWITFNIFGAY